MKTLELTSADRPLKEYARDADQEPLVITKKGRPVAALVPLAETDLETLSLGTNEAFLELIQRSQARHAAEGGISSEEMRRRLGLDDKPTGP